MGSRTDAALTSFIPVKVIILQSCDAVSDWLPAARFGGCPRPYQLFMRPQLGRGVFRTTRSPQSPLSADDLIGIRAHEVVMRLCLNGQVQQRSDLGLAPPS